MKVLFVNKFLDKHTIYRVPLGILYLSSAIKKAGHEVFICEPNRENVFDKVERVKPDVIAYSVRTGFHRYYIDLNKKLKEKFSFFSVFGGPHATFFPEMIMEEGIDSVAKGECESAIVDLVDCMENGRNYLETPNFWFKSRGKIFKNPLRNLEQNLDNILFPDRALLDGFKEIKLSRIHNFITARGCPYNCSYCFNHQLKEMYAGQNYVRRRSVDNVMEEIKRVKENYNLERVHFEDDTFNLDKEWLREFTLKYPKIPFKCNIRGNLIDEETVRLLKEANCISVTFAIEAGNDRVRNEILKRNMSKEQIINCAKLLKKYKIRFITENILANPTSTLSDDIETLDLNLVCKPDYPTVSLLQPYPQTEIFKIAVANNQFSKENIDKLESFFKFSPLQIPNKIERNNLQKLFALITAFPVLRRFLDFLINKKRLAPVYSLFYQLWRPYCLVFKIMPHRLTLREIYWLGRRYLTD
ncbi:MAG: radical SAM protein [bacterium]|nr:radical SAM protein [bacterium]